MQFIGDVARKVDDPDVLRVEAEKTMRAERIGRESGLFVAPRVLRFDAEAGVLDFELIPGLIPYSALVARSPAKADELAERIGRALALIHARLELDDEMRLPLPPEWACDGDQGVFLHGDFTANNICVDEARDRLVIVDWSAARLVGRSPTHGSRSFDLIFFARHLHMCATWRRLSSWPAAALSDRFILSYVDAGGAKLDASAWRLLRQQSDRIARREVRTRSREARLPARLPRALMLYWLYTRWLRYRPPPEAMSEGGGVAERSALPA